MDTEQTIVVPVGEPIGNGFQLARPNERADDPILGKWVAEADGHRMERMVLIMKENRRDQAILASRR